MDSWEYRGRLGATGQAETAMPLPASGPDGVGILGWPRACVRNLHTRLAQKWERPEEKVEQFGPAATSHRPGESADELQVRESRRPYSWASTAPHVLPHSVSFRPQPSHVRLAAQPFLVPR